MVSAGSMAGMILQIVVGIVVPIAFAVYFHKKYRLSVRALFTGILVFILFSQLLEKALHYYLLSANAATAAWLKNPWLLAVYGAIAAGLFEEIGRWAGFTVLLKKRRTRRDGLSLGLGHGGIETLLIGVVTGVQALVFSLMLNAGNLERTLGAQVPPDQIARLKQQLTETAPLSFWLGALERIPALVIQIALSLVVLYGVRLRKKRYLLYAVLLHAAFDFFPGLYQARHIPLWAAECVVWISGVVGLWIIVRSKRWFEPLDQSV